MNKRRLQSLGRKALIVLLLGIAVLLLNLTGFAAGLRSAAPGSRSETSESADGELSAPLRPTGAVQPIAAMVDFGNGAHCGAAWGGDSVSAVFQRFSADLGEALGSAETPEPLEEEDFFSLLNRPGVFLRFFCPQPLELLSVWLGAEVSGAAAGRSAELLCLFTENGTAVLSFRTAEGEYYRCATAVSADGLNSRTAEYTGNGAVFAFEDPLLRDGDGCAVVIPGERSAVQVRCTVPKLTSAETDGLLQALGMNSYVTGSYAEADGTSVFLDKSGTLRLSPDGDLTFRRTDRPEKAGLQTAAEAASLAWQTAERCTGFCRGDGSLLFAGILPAAEGRSWTVCFDYALNGIPVEPSSGHAVEITVEDGAVIQARAELRSFSAGEDDIVLLPDLQAHAIAAARHAGAALCYSAGGETMNCDWVKTDG